MERLKEFSSKFIGFVKEEAIENNQSVEQQFTEDVIEYIKEEGLAMSPELFYCESTEHKSMTDYYKINAFDYSETSGILDLFITLYVEQKSENIPELTIKRIENAHNAIVHFLNLCTRNNKLFDYYREKGMDDIAEIVGLIGTEFADKHISFVRFFILSNCVFKDEYEFSQEIDISGKPIDCEFSLWDINAIQKSDVAAREDGNININFADIAKPIECLEMSESNSVRSYLAIIPASILAKVYDTYKARLLNQNVRNYLGGKIKVNKKMIATLRTNPAMFFAYNNGISSTATQVELIKDETGKIQIKGVVNWQIVNGGQTTNTIYTIYKSKEKSLLDNVFVTLKVSEILLQDEKEKGATISDIARYANSQTQIKESDLCANDKYMLDLEDLSKSEMTPGGSKRKDTYWFFERMRAQYDNDKRLNKGKKWELAHPKNQKFSKTDIAKWEMSWNLYPHIASKGGEVCFDKFFSLYLEKHLINVDRTYYRNLIAKAILYQSIEQINKEKGVKGYLNIICNYVMATIAHKTNKNLNLDYIWNHQDIHPQLVSYIVLASDIVNKYILKVGEDGTNPSVKAKKDSFWNDIMLRMVKLPELDKVLLAVHNDNELTDEEKSHMEDFSKYTIEDWSKLSSWGKANKKLSLLERKKIDHIVAMKNLGKDIPYTMANDALSIIEKFKGLI